MSEVSLVLKLAKHVLDDTDDYHVQVTVEEGDATNNDLLELGLSVVATAIATEERLSGRPLDDLLEDVWNRLADMVETTQSLNPLITH